MQCTSCSSENPAAARFCAMCGARLASACPHCAAQLTPGARFCTACGETVTAAATELEAVVGQDAAWPTSAERRRISVMFVDLVDFAGLAESMDPEDVRRIQSRYFEIARSVVAKYEGSIEKFIGDAVMAVWGAPLAHEDDAERAVRAALALVYGVERIGDAGAGTPLRARAAIATGEAAVTVGAIGQGMVSGDLINVAARLQTRAPVGGVLVDPTTRDRAARAATYERVGSLSLKGRTGRVTAYRAVASPADPGSRQAGGHTGPFVGRDREMRELTDLLETVIRERRCRVISVTGIAGIGKSRLAWELGAWVDALDGDVAWHEGRSAAYGDAIAFGPVAEMVRRRIRIGEGAPRELVRRQLAAGLAQFVADEAERRWIEPRVATLLDRDATATFDRDELFAAWRRFFEHVADRMPVVMVFEDLQWAEPSLLAFIEHLATWSRDHPILIVTLARNEFTNRHPSWGSALSTFTALQLEHLPDTAMRELLAQRAPDLPDRVIHEILERAGGVPLYAVEVVRILRQPGDTNDLPRAMSWGDDLEPIDVPDSLHGLIAARIDGLPAGDRRLLLAASVLGYRFRPEALLTVTEGDPALKRQQIDHLVKWELLARDEELNSPGHGELGFLQDLVRDVAYQRLARADRRSLHLAAARYLESLGDDVAEPLARHLVQAHRLTSDARERLRLARRAVAALRHAARNETLVHVPERAVALLDRALALSKDTEQHGAVLEELADAARASGQLSLAEQHLRELGRIQLAAGQRRAAARTRARLAGVLLAERRTQLAVAELETAMRSTRGWEKDASGIEVAAQLARAHALIGKADDALAWADRALVAARRLDLTAIAVDLLVTRGTALLGSGDEDAGLANLRDAIEHAQEAGSLHSELRARNNLAWALLADDPRAAMQTAREALDLATTLGSADAATPLADIACTAAVETADWDWALSTMRELGDGRVSEAYRVLFATTAAIIGMLRGHPPLADVIETVDLPPDADAQVLAAVHHARAWRALLDGSFDEARRLADASIAGYVGNDPPYQRALAVRACLWLGDREGAVARLDRQSSARGGRATVAASITMRAGIAALDGQPDAPSMYRQAAEAWETLDLPLQRALCLLDRHRLLDDDPAEVVAAVDAVGAPALLRLLRPDRRDGDSRVRKARSPRTATGSARSRSTND